jgi:HD-like signal output (HDOD) protein
VSAKVLQLVNSAYFGLAQPITAIHQAVLYLGVDMMRTLTLTAHVFSKEQITQLDGFSMPKLQQQATLCAHLASRLVEDNGMGDEAYAAGLLHDIGQIALAVGMPIKFAEAYRTARFRRQPLHAIEQELLGVTHAEVGACLLSSWGLPLPIVEAVSCQHGPSATGAGPRPIVAALHLADALVTGAFNREDERTVTSRLDLPYLMQAGLGDDIPAWYQLAKEQLPQPGARRQIS